MCIGRSSSDGRDARSGGTRRTRGRRPIDVDGLLGVHHERTAVVAVERAAVEHRDADGEHGRPVAREDARLVLAPGRRAGPSRNGRSRPSSSVITDTGIELVRHLDDGHHRIGAARVEQIDGRVDVLGRGAAATWAAAARRRRPETPRARASRRRAAAPAASACRRRRGPPAAGTARRGPSARPAAAIAGSSVLSTVRVSRRLPRAASAV